MRPIEGIGAGLLKGGIRRSKDSGRARLVVIVWLAGLSWAFILALSFLVRPASNAQAVAGAPATAAKADQQSADSSASNVATGFGEERTAQGDADDTRNREASSANYRIALRASDAARAAAEIPGLLDALSPEMASTARDLLEFGECGDLALIRNLGPAEVRKLVDFLGDRLGDDELRSALESNGGIPPDALQSDGAARAMAVDLYNAVRGEPLLAATRAGVVVTDAVRPDASVAGGANVIPADAAKVCAVFQNQGRFQGLDNLFAVWRDDGRGQIVAAENHSIETSSGLGYVWIAPSVPLPPGRYSLDLCDTRDHLKLVARQSFTVK